MAASLYDLRVNDLPTDAIGRGNEIPCIDETTGLHFSWRVLSEGAGTFHVEPVAYQIQLSSASTFAPAQTVWDSGTVASGNQIRVRVPLPPSSFSPYWARVRVRVGLEGSSAWTEWLPTTFETGRLGGTGWTSRLIAPPGPARSVKDSRPAWFKSTFTLLSPPRRSRIYTTSLGWYRLIVNSRPVNGDSQVPRYTPFDKMLEYQSYDVSRHLRLGQNAITIVVGDGRFRGSMGMRGARNVYGDQVAAFAELHVELEDGTRRLITTDNAGWVAGYGPITAADSKIGETVDLRNYAEVYDRWTIAGKTPEGVQPAVLLPIHPRILVGEDAPPVRQVMALPATRLWRSPSNLVLVDFGQNLTGTASVKLPAAPMGHKDASVKMTFSEVLLPSGELDKKYLDPGSTPAPVDLAFLDREPHTWRPWFTYRGFRYVEIDASETVLSQLTASDLVASVYSSDINYTGTFQCSNPELEQLHHNALWSWRGNNMDTTLDCPTRERSGWTGDLQVFTPTALLLSDATSVLRRFMRNLALEQVEDGRVPIFVPTEAGAFSGGFSTVGKMFSTSAGWGDACVIIPWKLYMYRGDLSILAEYYDTMKRWVRYTEYLASNYSSIRRFFNRRRVGALEKYVVDRGVHFGEWFRPGESGIFTIIFNLIFSGAVVPTAYFAASSRMLSNIARLLGKSEDEAYFGALADRATLAYRGAFVGQNGSRIGEDRQDDYVRALAFNLITTEERGGALRRLVELVEKKGNHLDTGFLSTPLLLSTLADNGRVDVAYRILLQTSTPSWIAQVRQGATTAWESWECYDAKGKAHLSHNHYSYGSVCQFLLERIVGITPAEPGYKRIKIQPFPGGGLTHAHSAIDTPYGKAECGWALERAIKEPSIRIRVTIPYGTEADVYVGQAKLATVGPGSHAFDEPFAL